MLAIYPKVMGIAALHPSCTLLSVRCQSNDVDWEHGPIYREQPYPSVPRAPT
jgi:hypothetical protein